MYVSFWLGSRGSVKEKELDAELGRYSALILWDGKEFYDRLDSQVVVSCATAEGFPPVALALAFACHRMPRVLTAQGVGRPYNPGDGSVPCAGVYLLHVVDPGRGQIPHSRSGTRPLSG